MPFPELLEHLRRDEADAWDEFYRRYEPLLRRIARRWMTASLRRQADSMDVVQSVFRIALGAVPGTPFASEGRFIAWLDTVTRHRISHLGRREHGPRRERFDSIPEAGLTHDATLTAEDAAAHAEDLHRLKVAMDGLAPAEREVILLRDFEGLPFAAVAERLGRPSDEAARKLHQRACARLAARIGERLGGSALG